MILTAQKANSHICGSWKRIRDVTGVVSHSLLSENRKKEHKHTALVQYVSPDCDEGKQSYQEEMESEALEKTRVKGLLEEANTPLTDQ